MAILNLGRVRPVFRGEFSDLDGTTIREYDVVTHAGSAWFFTDPIDMIADATIGAGNWPGTPGSAGRFKHLAKGVQVVGNWSDNNVYYENQVISFGSSSYIARTTVPANMNLIPGAATSYWQEFATGFGNFADEYIDGQGYGTGDIVTWRGSTYIASTAISADNGGNHRPDRWLPWDIVSLGFHFMGSWEQAKISELFFSVGTVLEYRGSAYVVENRLGVNSSVVPANGSEYKKIVEGVSVGYNQDASLQGQWDPNVTYQKGELVSYINAIYIATREINAGDRPGAEPASAQGPGWSEMLALDTRYVSQVSANASRVRYRFIGYPGAPNP